MTDLESHNELLRSLGRMVRGLSALFWGLPIALIVCFHTARSDSFKSLGIIPPLVCTGWLVYGLFQLGDFQRQERVWRQALDRARLLSLVLLGFSPFLFWWNRMPSNPFFLAIVLLSGVTALLFLVSLNLLLQRLGAILPDEALRTEIRQFTTLNLNLLAAMFVFGAILFLLIQLPGNSLPVWALWIRVVLDRMSLWFLIPLVLLPLAMTMALLWKTKEVIMDGVFGSK